MHLDIDYVNVCVAVAETGDSRFLLFIINIYYPTNLARLIICKYFLTVGRIRVEGNNVTNLYTLPKLV
jgi:hypothetical protein